MGSLRTRDCRLLPADTLLDKVFQEFLPPGDAYFVVVDNGAPCGVLDSAILLDSSKNKGQIREIDLDLPVSTAAAKNFMIVDAASSLADFLNENPNLETNHVVVTEPRGSCRILTKQCLKDIKAYLGLTMRRAMPLEHYALPGLQAGETCFKALEMLSKEGVESLLVSEGGQALGVLSRTDLALLIAQRRNLWKLAVEDAANRNIDILSPDAPARTASTLLTPQGAAFLLCRMDGGGYALITRQRLDRHLHPHLGRLVNQPPLAAYGLRQTSFLGEMPMGQSMTESLRIGILALSPDLRVQDCNRLALDLLRANLEYLLEQDSATLAAKYPFFAQLVETAQLLAQGSQDTAILPPSPDLEAAVQAKMTAVREDGSLRGYIVAFQDTSDSGQDEGRLRKLAYYDALTGLPNRELLLERLSIEIKRCKRSNERFALLFVDLDGFKAINDSLGHHAGDELLRQVAGRFADILRETDTVVRLGGDEFVFILPGAQSEKQARIVMEKVRTVLRPRFELGGETAAVGCSIGWSVFPSNGATPQSLIASADHLMYIEKFGKRPSPQARPENRLLM